MKQIRYSKQREAIKEYLKSVKTHPTAEEVYNALKTKNPELSLGTVYRNLNFLVDKLEVKKINNINGVVRYDGNIEPHYHFICSKCSKIQDIELDKQIEINKIVDNNVYGDIETHEINFLGICNSCNQNN